MMFFKKIRVDLKTQRLQKQFDTQVAEVQRLMTEGDIDASGKALLEAERLRREIEELNPNTAEEENQTVSDTRDDSQ